LVGTSSDRSMLRCGVACALGCRCLGGFAGCVNILLLSSQYIVPNFSGRRHEDPRSRDDDAVHYFRVVRNINLPKNESRNSESRNSETPKLPVNQPTNAPTNCTKKAFTAPIINVQPHRPTRLRARNQSKLILSSYPEVIKSSISSFLKPSRTAVSCVVETEFQASNNWWFCEMAEVPVTLVLEQRSASTLHIANSPLPENLEDVRRLADASKFSILREQWASTS
jgi:hypothetical protein